MKSKIILLVSCFGLALVLIGLILYAQRGNAGGKQLAELRAQAEKGDAKAENELGSAYQFGKLGVAQDRADEGPRALLSSTRHGPVGPRRNGLGVRVAASALGPR